MAEVYLITNKVNEKRYIGFSSISAKRRWYEHLYAARSGRTTSAIHNAIAKYGPESFEIIILGVGNINSMLKLERISIAEFNTIAPNGYNLTEGGEFSEYSDETRRKMSISAKSRCTKEHVDRFNSVMGSALKEYWSDPENRRKRAEQARVNNCADKMHERNRELWQNPDYRARQSASRKALWQNPEYRARQKASRIAAWKVRKAKA